MKTERNYWIVALALLMFFVAMISAQMTGMQNGFYYFVWVVVGYYGFKSNYELIKTWMGIAIIINLVGLLVIFVINEDGVSYISSGGKLELALGVVVMLIPKLILYYYSKVKIESNYNGEQDIGNEVIIKNPTANDFSKKSLHDPLAQKKLIFPIEQTQLLHKNEIITHQPDSIIKGVDMENDHEVWERILNEYEGADRKKGLWAKLFVELDGDERKIKIQYLKIRVEQLMQESSLVPNKKLEISSDHVFNMEVEASKAKISHQSKNVEDYITAGIFLEKKFMDHEYYLYPNGQAAIIWADELRLYSEEFYVQSALKVYVRSGVLPIVGFARNIKINSK